MKLMFTTLWGRTRKLAGRGLKLPNGEYEAHILTRIAYYVAERVEKEGHIGIVATYGSFKDRCEFANKIGADLFFVLTMGIENGTFVGYDYRNPDGNVMAGHLAYYLGSIFDIRYYIEELGGKDNRYGMISFLDPKRVYGFVLSLCDVRTYTKFLNIEDAGGKLLEAIAKALFY